MLIPDSNGQPQQVIMVIDGLDLMSWLPFVNDQELKILRKMLNLPKAYQMIRRRAPKHTHQQIKMIQIQYNMLRSK